MEQKKRSSFSSRIGFVLAAAGSAVGLGNLWRFPYLAARYGGGIFLLVYLILALTFGFSLMITEIAIGRKTRLSCIGAYKALDKRFGFLGWLAAFVPFIITPYYCVIGGWVMKYLFTFISGNALEAADNGGFFSNFIGYDAGSLSSTIFSFNGPTPWFILFVLATTVVVIFGVEKGIEKASRIMMPILAILAIVIAIYSLTIPGALQGLKYYILPDFSQFSVSTVLGAMGQMFYSMSLAMGIMITYGSYVKPEVNLNKAINQIEIFDTGVAFLAGAMIIPAVYVFSGTEGMGAGPSLMFISLPKVFSAMGKAGTFVGILFFVTAIFATLSSCISVLESITANCMEIFHTSRKKTVLVLSVIYLAASAVIALGYSIFYVEVKLPNGSVGQLLDIMDYISNSVMMPFIALLSTILIGWVVTPDYVISQMERSGDKFRRKKLYRVMIRFVAPVMMFILFLQSTGILS